MTDYYEFLQISPNADSETIHRVYRFLATRLHPDNPESGDAEMFHLLKTAYDALSNPVSRAEYDATRRQEQPQAKPFSASVDFMDCLDGELNRRLAVLAVLYYRRRTNPHLPEVPLVEIEERMGFPRDYLDFTTWYLMKKGYVNRADNAEFTLTAEGVDFVETQRANIPVLNKMLTNGSGSPDADQPLVNKRSAATRERIVLHPSTEHPAGRAMNGKNHHAEAAEETATDGTVVALDRRVNPLERRSNPRGRRSSD